MALEQPQATDLLNNPSHSKMHRVIAIDSAANDQAFYIDSASDGQFANNVNLASGKHYKINNANLTFSDVNAQSKFTPTAVKTSAYNANVGELVLCDISSASFAVTLPTAPADGSQIQVFIVVVGSSTALEVKTGGTDKFVRTGGPTSLYMTFQTESAVLQYQASTGIWFVNPMAAPSNFAVGFPGFDSQTPITNANISIDTTGRVLTITPPLGYFNIFVDGGGKITKFRKTTVNFPAFTDTSGIWYFYFDSTGTAVTTQTPWFSSNFSTICLVYRILWNSTLTGAAKLVAQYIEYHENTISADDHQWYHQQGAIVLDTASSFVMANNALVSGAPNADGRNTVIALSSGSAVDDNLEYTVSNSTGGAAWQQDLGNTTPASLNATNSALFKVYTQDGSGNVTFLPATRFPFDWNSGTNIPNFITATGTRTPITNGNFMVNFVYATQNPVNGEALKIVSATAQFTSLTNARAYNWVDIQTNYPTLFGSDGELRPLYRLIHEVHSGAPGAYDVGAKFAVLRETQDLRRTAVTSSAVATGSIPASSVTFVPAGNIASTNVQAAIEELDTEKAQLTGATFTGNISAPNVIRGYSTTTTAGATTTLDVNSNYKQYFTGTSTQTVVLPVTSTLTLGHRFEIYNNSTLAVTVNSSGGNAVVILATGTSAIVDCIAITGTDATSWNVLYRGYNVTSAKKISVTNTLTLSGTDGTTMTFPSTSSSLAPLVSPSFTTPNLGTPSAGTLTSCTGLPIAGLVSSTSTALGVGSLELGHASDTTLTRIAAGMLGVEGEVLNGFTSTATATGTTTMDITYTKIQQFTGTTTQTVKLPTTGVIKGQQYIIQNIGTSNAAVVTVQSSGANTILILGYGCTGIFTSTQATPTTAAHWTFEKRGRNITTATSFTTDTGTSLNCDYYDTFIITAQAGDLKFNNPTGTPKDGQTLWIAVTGTAARALTWDTQFEASAGAALPSTTVTTARLDIGFVWRADTSKWHCVASA